MSSTYESNCKENNISNRSSSSFNTHTNITSAAKKAHNEEPTPFLGSSEKVESEGIPEGGDELTRYESNPKASRTLSHMMTDGEVLLNKANDNDELLPKIDGGR